MPRFASSMVETPILQPQVCSSPVPMQPKPSASVQHPSVSQPRGPSIEGNSVRLQVLFAFYFEHSFMFTIHVQAAMWSLNSTQSFNRKRGSFGLFVADSIRKCVRSYHHNI